MPTSSVHSLLPHPAPSAGNQRLVLYAIRRMAAGGIADAHAASAYLFAFGLHYRRPLVLTRTLVTEMSRAAATKLLVAPCCCPRMSASEQLMLDGLATVRDRPAAAHATLAHLLKVPSCTTVMSSAEALAACFADLGRPVDAAC